MRMLPHPGRPLRERWWRFALTVAASLAAGAVLAQVGDTRQASGALGLRFVNPDLAGQSKTLETNMRFAAQRKPGAAWSQEAVDAAVKTARDNWEKYRRNNPGKVSKADDRTFDLQIHVLNDEALHVKGLPNTPPGAAPPKIAEPLNVYWPRDFEAALAAQKAMAVMRDAIAVGQQDKIKYGEQIEALRALAAKAGEAVTELEENIAREIRLGGNSYEGQEAHLSDLNDLALARNDVEVLNALAKEAANKEKLFFPAGFEIGKQ